jgi:hypothetical protein
MRVEGLTPILNVVEHGGDGHVFRVGKGLEED